MKELKELVSLRLFDCDRTDIQAIANRLIVRESDVYRFAIDLFLNRFSCLLDLACVGSDLLLPLCEVRAEMNNSLNLNRHQLEKIINGNNLNPDKYVAMSDIELFLMPQHALKQRLIKLTDLSKNNLDIEEWLKLYLIEKYRLYGVNNLNVTPLLINS